MGHCSLTGAIKCCLCVRQPFFRLLAALAALVVSARAAVLDADVVVVPKETVESTCSLESFLLIDANTIAKRAGIPLCNVDKMFSVSTETGQIFLADSEEAKSRNATSKHFFGTYAAPWFLYQGLEGSPYQTSDSGRASLIYFSDYCYYMWWLAAAQSKTPVEPSPGTYLVKIYEELLKSSQWNRQKGSDFVFFFPWSITHVTEYERTRQGQNAIPRYQEIVCGQLQSALHITMENLQGRSMCKESKKATLVAPYVPNVVDIKRQALMESLTSIQREVHGLDDRTTLLYFKGRCSHHSQNPSRLLRSHVAAALADETDDIHVKCVEKEGRLPFGRLLSEMEKSVFCLVLPESGQSARSLSEVMMAGCIPVFLGPPFAAMPFKDDLEFDVFSLSLYVDKHEWLGRGNSRKEVWKAALDETEFALESGKAMEFDGRLEALDELVPFIRSISKETLTEALEEVQKVRRSFLYFPELDSESPSAVDLLTLNLCRHINRLANS